ncbi:MAG: DMT family transporter [Alphaproteobacteria bacterium]|nr:DMT family transporter [Alphaproteobacteria bacterium]HRI75351.1 DMT family transporter [Alphaproteobacteria bacterium]
MTAGLLPDVPRHGRGIVLMLGSALSLSVMNAAVKALTLSGYHTLQIVLTDCLFGFASVFLWLAATGRLRWVRRVRPMLACYVGAAICACFSLFYGFGHGGLAQISAVVAAAPLLVAVLSFFFLGERLTRWQVTLALAGFGGILLILQPGMDMQASLPLIVTLGGTIALAASQVLVRYLNGQIHTAAFILYFYVGAAAVSGALVVGNGLWTPVAAGDMPLFLLCALADIAALVCMYSAFRHAPASLVTPFQYSNIVWSALLGYVIWQEQPGLWTAMGAGIIIGAGILFTRAALRRQQVAAA